MNAKLKYLSLLALILLNSCSADDPLINSFDDSWRYLVAGPIGVSTIRMPAGTIENASVWTSDQLAPYPVYTIKPFRDRIYLLLKQDAVVVLNGETLEAVDTIQLVGKGLVSDIAFANASTAYVALPESNEVGVIDITTGNLARTISMVGSPTGLAVLGNQICVAIQDKNEAAIVDTRTNTVELSIPIDSPAPTYVAADPINQAFGVVSLGAGKRAGDTEPKTTPQLTFINLEGWTVNGNIDLTWREDQGPDQVPGGITVNSNQFMFVPVQSSLLFVSTRSQNRASSIQFEPYSWVGYHGARAELLTIVQNGTSIQVFDELGESLKHTVTMNDSVACVVGIAP